MTMIPHNGSNNNFKDIGGVPGDAQNGNGSYVLGHGLAGSGVCDDDEYLQLEHGEDGGATLLPNDDGMGIDDSRSFNSSDGMEVGMETVNMYGMGKSGEFHHNEQRESTMNEEEENRHGGEGSSNEGEISPEVEAITRQATNQLNTALEETQDLAGALFKELTVFLNEAVAVQKDFDQVRLAVRNESERLDNLEPVVERATHEILMQAQANGVL